jgi:hypothetical protein
MTDVPLIALEGHNQFLMATGRPPIGAPVIRRQPVEYLLLQSGQASCGHRHPLLSEAWSGRGLSVVYATA